jgi:hypothetical protein
LLGDAAGRVFGNERIDQNYAAIVFASKIIQFLREGANCELRGFIPKSN